MNAKMMVMKNSEVFVTLAPVVVYD